MPNKPTPDILKNSKTSHANIANKKAIFPTENVAYFSPINNQVNSLQEYLGLSPFQKLEKLLTGINPNLATIPLHLGEPDSVTSNFTNEIIKPILDSPEFLMGLAKYPPVTGTSAWRSAVHGWATKRFHLTPHCLQDNNFLPTTGSREGLYTAIMFAIQKKRLHLKPSQRPLIITTEPFYHVYKASALLNSADFISCFCFKTHHEPVKILDPSKGRQLAPDRLSLALAIQNLKPNDLQRLAAVVVTTPDNPTGRCLTLQEMEQLNDIAITNQAIIISDECYSDLHYGVEPLSFLNVADQGFGLKNIIVSNSLSKRSSVPGLRSGVLITDVKHIPELITIRAHIAAIPSLSSLLIATILWQDETHVNLNRVKYQLRLKIAKQIIGDSASFQKPEGGFFLFLKTTDGEKSAVEIFTKTGIKLLPAIYMSALPDSLNKLQKQKHPAFGYLRLSMTLPSRQEQFNNKPPNQINTNWESVLTNLRPFLLPSNP